MSVVSPAPPIPPRPPAALHEQASERERAAYRRLRVRYDAELRIYQTDVRRYQNELNQFSVDMSAGEPQPLIDDSDAPDQGNPGGDSSAPFIPAQASVDVVDAEMVSETPVAAATHNQVGEDPPAPAKDPIFFDYNGSIFERPADLGNINLAMNLAVASSVNGVEAGDYRWCNSEKDFEMIDIEGTAMKMDVDEFQDFVRAMYSAE